MLQANNKDSKETKRTVHYQEQLIIRNQTSA